jgi:hypothetical protein
MQADREELAEGFQPWVSNPLRSHSTHAPSAGALPTDGRRRSGAIRVLHEFCRSQISEATHVVDPVAAQQMDAKAILTGSRMHYPSSDGYHHVRRRAMRPTKIQIMETSSSTSSAKYGGSDPRWFSGRSKAWTARNSAIPNAASWPHG